MGWLDDTGQHEGFVRGWQRVSLGEGPFAGSELREIQCPIGATTGSRELDVCAVQVCCECGWRSPLLRAPLGTKWSPCIVHFPDHDRESEASERREELLGPKYRCFEKECFLAWKDHLSDLLPGEFFSRKLYPRR
jgi:hypothetical protein